MMNHLTQLQINFRNILKFSSITSSIISLNFTHRFHSTCPFSQSKHSKNTHTHTHTEQTHSACGPLQDILANDLHSSTMTLHMQPHFCHEANLKIKPDQCFPIQPRVLVFHIFPTFSAIFYLTSPAIYILCQRDVVGPTRNQTHNQNSDSKICRRKLFKARGCRGWGWCLNFIFWGFYFRKIVRNCPWEIIFCKFICETLTYYIFRIWESVLK